MNLLLAATLAISAHPAPVRLPVPVSITMPVQKPVAVHTVQPLVIWVPKVSK